MSWIQTIGRLNSSRLSTLFRSCTASIYISTQDQTLLTEAKELTARLIGGDRYGLAQSITLLESTNPERRIKGQYILDEAAKYLAEQEQTKKRFTFRIGVLHVWGPEYQLLDSLSGSNQAGEIEIQSPLIGLSGPPGAGKSTFIEAFGSRLTGSIPWNPVAKEPNASYGGKRSIPADEYLPESARKQHHVAVLAVDPSSNSTGGSLLADKTRMPDLSRDLNAYIRPSPSSGNLGGVARATNESVILCEAAGYDIVLIETVGVGQSEFAVADMVDMFVLIIPPAGGDELQGIKRGIVEVADIVLVNKADGDLLPAAKRIAGEYSNALRYMRMRRQHWRPTVMLASSLKGTGITEFWATAFDFHRQQLESNELQRLRREQLKVWMWTYIKEGIWENFKTNPSVDAHRAEIENLVLQGKLGPGPAAEKLMALFRNP